MSAFPCAVRRHRNTLLFLSLIGRRGLAFGPERTLHPCRHEPVPRRCPASLEKTAVPEKTDDLMLYRLIIPTIMACSVGTATAQDLTVRGPHSGLWFNPDQPGHGIDVDVINTRQAVVSWYAYNDDGQPYWLLGTGNIDGPTIDIFFRSYRGGSFPQDSTRPKSSGRRGAQQL